MSQIRGEVSDEERGIVEKYCRKKHSGLERGGAGNPHNATPHAPCRGRLGRHSHLTASDLFQITYLM